MLHAVTILYSEFSLVVDESLKQRGEILVSHLLRRKKEKWAWVLYDRVSLEAKEQHYIYTKHKHSMKRLLNSQIVFQSEN